MTWKLRLGIALLYGGPILAGISGHSIWSIIALTLVFTLWVILNRAASTTNWFTIPLMAVVQLVLVAIGFGIGSLIRYMFGLDVELALFFPILISALGLLPVLKGPPPMDPEMDQFLDEALSSIENLAPLPDDYEHYPDEDALSDEHAETLRLALEHIAELPNDPPESMERKDTINAISAILEPLEHAPLTWVALDNLAQTDGAHLPNVLAQAMFALRPYVASKCLGTNETLRAVDRALETGSPRIINAVALQAIALLDALPEAQVELPSVTELLSTAAQQADTAEYAAHSLRALCKRITELEQDAQ